MVPALKRLRQEGHESEASLTSTFETVSEDGWIDGRMLLLYIVGGKTYIATYYKAAEVG